MPLTVVPVLLLASVLSSTPPPLHQTAQVPLSTRVPQSAATSGRQRHVLAPPSASGAAFQSLVHNVTQANRQAAQDQWVRSQHITVDEAKTTTTEQPVTPVAAAVPDLRSIIKERILAKEGTGATRFMSTAPPPTTQTVISENITDSTGFAGFVKEDKPSNHNFELFEQLPHALQVSTRATETTEQPESLPLPVWPRSPSLPSIADLFSSFRLDTTPSSAFDQSLAEPIIPVSPATKDFVIQPKPNPGKLAAPYKSIFSVLFGDSGTPNAISLFPHSFIPITTTTKRPETTARPESLFDAFLQLIQTPQQSIPKKSGSQSKTPILPTLIISQDSKAAKKYLLDHLLPALEQIYTSVRDSDLQVPLQHPSDFDGFQLDADDFANSFVYQFVRNVLSEGLGGVRRETSLREDLMALTQKVLNPNIFLGSVRDVSQFKQWKSQRKVQERQAASVAMTHPNPIHHAFEADFDSMNEESWFETPEFIVSISVASVILLLAVIAGIVNWNKKRKSNSFPVSIQQMNYEEGSKSQIVYI